MLPLLLPWASLGNLEQEYKIPLQLALVTSSSLLPAPSSNRRINFVLTELSPSHCPLCCCTSRFHFLCSKSKNNLPFVAAAAAALFFFLLLLLFFLLNARKSKVFPHAIMQKESASATCGQRKEKPTTTTQQTEQQTTLLLPALAKQCQRANGPTGRMSDFCVCCVCCVAKSRMPLFALG